MSYQKDGAVLSKRHSVLNPSEAVFIRQSAVRAVLTPSFKFQPTGGCAGHWLSPLPLLLLGDPRVLGWSSLRFAHWPHPWGWQITASDAAPSIFLFFFCDCIWMRMRIHAMQCIKPYTHWISGKIMSSPYAVGCFAGLLSPSYPLRTLSLVSVLGWLR